MEVSRPIAAIGFQSVYLGLREEDVKINDEGFKVIDIASNGKAERKGGLTGFRSFPYRRATRPETS
jgi:hypothetical protein